MLTLLVATILASQGQVEEMRLMRWPDVYGDNVVFTYASDLWLTDRKGDVARRLTSHTGMEYLAKYSPDGKWIAFTGGYDGNPEVYIIPSEGGEPKRLTFDPAPDLVVGWTPDGKIVYKSASGTFNNKMPVLWRVDPKGGPSERTPIMEISDGSYSPDGSAIAYNRAPSHNFNWRRYRGGTQGFISVFEFADNKYWELPHKRENSWFPMWVGDSIYYVSDRNQGTVNLYRYDVKSKQDKQLTNFTDADIKWPKTDGKTIVYERDAYLYTYDIASGQIAKLSPKVLSDNVAARPAVRSLSGYISNLDLSPSGVRIAVEARGEIFSVPQKNGETRNVTNSPANRERFPAWSPDGQTLAYLSDATGEWEVYTVPQMGGKPTQVTVGAKIPAVGISWTPDSKKLVIPTRSSELWLLDLDSKKLTQVFKSKFGLGSFDVSPDSKWIAYTDQQKNYLSGIYLYDISSGKTTQVTDGYYDDTQISFDLNGKYLYFISARTFNIMNGYFELAMAPRDVQRVYMMPLAKDTPNPLIAASDEEAVKPPPGVGPAAAGAPPATPGVSVKVDFDGLASRTIPLPMGAGAYNMIAGANNGVYYLSGPTMSKFDLGSRDSSTIYTGPFGIGAFNASRTKAAFTAGETLFTLDLRPGAQPQRVDISGVEAVIDPRLEWKQMYWEAWRYMRDNFYDANMVGIDWKTVGDRYAKYLPFVKHRVDLNYVFGLMIGELGTGHAYVQGGDMGPTVTPPVPIGLLGCDYEIAGDYIRFKKIYRGANYDESRRGPLMEPGVNVKEGDYLLEIDGNPIRRDVNPAIYLVRKAGRTVVLTVNDKPSMDGARKERVRPTGNEGELRYWSWVEDTRKKVSDMSGGRIGYMHIPDTQVQGTIEFMRGFWSQVDKDAVIVDERWNGGGFIQPWFVGTLARRVMAGYVGRNFGAIPDEVAIEGPKVMLINQYAGSGGDLFPWMFRQAGLGPLMGKRTWGGLVGINGFSQLADGGGITAPEFALFDQKEGEWIAENKGIDPDIDVDLRPDLLAQGRDAQIEKAVEYLMNELKKPRKEWKRPAYPVTKPPL